LIATSRLSLISLGFAACRPVAFTGNSRVTIFDGGHEWLPGAAIGWLADQRKP